MWLDQYPWYYPCECCGDVEEKQRDSMEVRHISSVADVVYAKDVRYHAYKREGKDELKAGLNLRGDPDSLRAMENAGLATVHEDQGSTHDNVHTVRLDDVYDKNASPVNPSLYNRECYVLTDTTRHKKAYVYSTLSSEVDCIIKRVERSRDPKLRALVRQKKGLGIVSLESLLE